MKLIDAFKRFMSFDKPKVNESTDKALKRIKTDKWDSSKETMKQYVNRIAKSRKNEIRNPKKLS